MSNPGVNVAIFQDNRVLLTLREDFEVWCLPGGATDDGEGLAAGARREALEETGLECELTRLVGMYSQPNWHEEGDHIAVFAANPVGGELRLQAGEVLEARYFGSEDLPEHILFGHRRRILDALQGASGAVWTQTAVWPFKRDLQREELYALRDASGLSRQAFYINTFGYLQADREICELT